MLARLSLELPSRPILWVPHISSTLSPSNPLSTQRGALATTINGLLIRPPTISVSPRRGPGSSSPPLCKSSRHKTQVIRHTGYDSFQYFGAQVMFWTRAGGTGISKEPKSSQTTTQRCRSKLLSLWDNRWILFSFHRPEIYPLLPKRQHWSSLVPPIVPLSSGDDLATSCVFLWVFD